MAHRLSLPDDLGATGQRSVTAMTLASDLIREGRTAEVWKKYCGFLDLNIQEFVVAWTDRSWHQYVLGVERGHQDDQNEKPRE